MNRPLVSPVRLVPLLVPLLWACGEDAATPMEMVEPLVPGRVELDRNSVELQLRDTLTLSATSFDQNGALLSTASVTWSSNDTNVAEVSTSGLVTGVGDGTARITATAGSASASADLAVLAWNIADHAVVVDSTVLALAGDAAERAQGTYRFTALGTALAIAVGDVIVGAQSGGFLRRVVTVSADGGEIVLETEPASLSEIVVEGSFETSIDDLVFTPEAVPPFGALRPGEVRWGPAEFHPALPGVSLNAAGGISLSGLDVCEELKKLGGATCPSGISKLQIVTGTLDFGPSFDLMASFSGLSLSSFRGVAQGAVSADFDILLEAKTSSTLISPQIKIAGVTRPFYAQIGPVPILGYVELALNGGLEAKATAKGHVQAGYTSSHNIEVGAEWKEASGWTPVFQNMQSFDAREPTLQDGTLSGQIDIETRLFLKPEIKIIFYGVVGPFLNVEPYGKFTMTFGTQSCGMKSEAGINSEIGFTIPFLDPKTGTLSDKKSPWLSWPGKDWTCPLGTLDVSTVTNGDDPDPDGYTVLVDDIDKGTIGSNAQTVLSFIEVGPRTVRLEGVAANCTVQGSNPVTVTVNTGLVSPVAFEVQCQSPGGDLVVTMQTTGQNLDPDGYTLTVDQSQSQDVGINGMATFAGLAQGDHDLSVSGVAPNCLLVGPNPRVVTVPSGGQVNVTIAVDCTASQLVVITTTQGPPASSDWSVTLDNAETRGMGPNDQTTFEVSDGPHSLRLDNVADNCTVQGDNPRNVTVSGQTTETFNVSCDAGGLTVTVNTTGDASPATSFTVAAGSTTQSVSVNGSVNFANLPTGLTSVELRDLPGQCLIQGENPRQVDVPGSTTFEVLCEAPVTCGVPPDVAYWDVELDESWNTSAPQPTMTNSIVKQNYGDIEVTSAVSVLTEDQNGNIWLRVIWFDQWKTIPVDQSRSGERVTLRVRITGLVAREVDPDSATVAESRTMGLLHRIATFQGTVDVENYVIDEVAEVNWELDEWVGVDGAVTASTVVVSSNPGASASARAAQKVQVLDVVDDSGLSVPIVQMCTASGVDYR